MQKLKGLKTLGETTFKWLRDQKTLKLRGRPPYENPMKSSERSRFFNIRTVAKKEISDLTKLLELLPEQQQEQIFTLKNLRPFFKALFTARSNEELSEDKRLQLLGVCNAALEQISIHNNGPQLAPNAWKVLRETPSSSQETIYGTKVIQALQIEGSVFVEKKG